jgi:hypothetical protein
MAGMIPLINDTRELLRDMMTARNTYPQRSTRDEVER